MVVGVSFCCVALSHFSDAKADIMEELSGKSIKGLPRSQTCSQSFKLCA